MPGTNRHGSVVERAKQAADYGRRGKGSIFGAFRPATGEALTLPYERRTSANWVDFIVLAETPALSQPGKGALDHPAPRQHHKAFHIIRPQHWLQVDPDPPQFL